MRRDDAMRLTCLEFAPLLHMDVNKRGGDRAIFVVAGPSLGYNVRASYEDEGMTENIRDDIEKFDAGLVLGTGYEHGPLMLEARYSWGFRKVFDTARTDGWSPWTGVRP